MPSYSVAVDVGGTFTDIVLCDTSSNAQWVHKTPSTPNDPSVGFMTGLTEILATNGVAASDVAHIFHGTTIATNSVLENRGAPVGLLVTEGFRYVLEIARHGTPRLANPNSWVKPQRPVRPRDCLEVKERTAFNGEILAPLDEAAVREAAGHFAREGVAAVAVAFLHSYANPDHERRAREILREELPGMAVSLSSEVLPVYREYERAITTVLNAYVTPRVSTYIDNLQSSLRAFGSAASLSIMKSNGGIIGADTAIQQPVYTALSGPAAGVMAALQIAEATASRKLHILRHGRHQHRRVPRAGQTTGPDAERPTGRLASPVADAGHRHHRLRRGQHRRGLAVRQPDGGAGQRRRRPGPGLLRQGIEPSHRYRCEPGPGTRQFQHCRRAADTGYRSRGRNAIGDAVASPLGMDVADRGQWHPANRQQRHGRRHSKHQRRARLRSPGTSLWWPMVEPGRCTL